MANASYFGQRKMFLQEVRDSQKGRKKRKASFLSVIDRERRVPEGYCVSGMTSGV